MLLALFIAIIVAFVTLAIAILRRKPNKFRRMRSAFLWTFVPLSLAMLAANVTYVALTYN